MRHHVRSRSMHQFGKPVVVIRTEPRHKKRWHVSKRFSRASEPRHGSAALSQPPYIKGSSACPRQYHIRYPPHKSTRLRTHRLRRRGDAALAKACVQAANTYGPAQRALCQRAYGAHAARPRAAQRGVVTLPEDSEQLSAVVRSGQQRLPGRHAPAHLHLCGLPEALAGARNCCAREITGRLGLLAVQWSRSTPPAPEPAIPTRLRTRSTHDPTWPISGAPASLDAGSARQDGDHLHHAGRR